MKPERHSTLSEKITAAAAVATAAAAAKTAAETTKARQEMEAMNRAMELSAQKQERIHLAMASEQAETNFRNTILATLPLLKNDQDKIQFLTEQFVPKLKDSEEEAILSPIQSIIVLEARNNDFNMFLEGDAGKLTSQHLAYGNGLLKRKIEWDEQIEAMQELEKEMQSIQNPITLANFVKSAVWVAIIYIAMTYFSFAGWTPFILACGFGLMLQMVIFSSVKAEQGKNRAKQKYNKLASSLTDDKAEVLNKELDLLKTNWKTIQPEIVEYLIEKYKPILTNDAREVIASVIKLKIEDDVKELQSFLPPSLRLLPSHYAQFLFDKDDVEKFKAEQNNIANLLGEKIAPDYENKAIVWK